MTDHKVPPHRLLKQDGFLADKTHLSAELLDANVTDIRSIEKDATRRHVVEALKYGNDTCEKIEVGAKLEQENSLLLPAPLAPQNAYDIPGSSRRLTEFNARTSGREGYRSCMSRLV